jgi:hypothetical protein
MVVVVAVVVVVVVVFVGVEEEGRPRSQAGGCKGGEVGKVGKVGGERWVVVGCVWWWNGEDSLA